MRADPNGRNGRRGGGRVGSPSDGSGIGVDMAGLEPNAGSERTSEGDFSTCDLRRAVHEFERRHIAAVLTSTAGNKMEAARRLGIGLSSLYRKLEELGIERDEPSKAVDIAQRCQGQASASCEE